jgi:hypothetical protein
LGKGWTSAQRNLSRRRSRAILGKQALSLTGYYGAADKYIGALQLNIVLP